MFWQSEIAVRIFKTRWVARFSRRERIEDRSLLEAILRAERGIIDADLGGGIIKQRVARPGQGRSGGFRMLVAGERFARHGRYFTELITLPNYLAASGPAWARRAPTAR